VRIVKITFETSVTVRARSAMTFACSVPYPILVDDDLLKKLNFAGPLVDLCVTSEGSNDRSMSTFDYEASAELFAAQGHPGFRHQRFDQAAEAIRYAIKKNCPPKCLRDRLSRSKIGAITPRRSARSMTASATL
jgi:hypothetical protein